MNTETCWCETEDDKHDERCDKAPMPLTKEEFVAAAGGGAKAAIETYLFLLNEEGDSHERALEYAVQEAEESASCFAGIGSCGSGWCKH